MLAKSKTEVPDRIQRYSRSDRARVFELLRVARAAGFASPLIDQWNWKYDDNPFNREAECYRRAHRDELLRIREQYSPEVLQKWDVRSEDDLPEREDDPLILVAKTRAGEVIAMLGAVPVRFLVGGAKEWARSRAIGSSVPSIATTSFRCASRCGWRPSAYSGLPGAAKPRE